MNRINKHYFRLIFIGLFLTAFWGCNVAPEDVYSERGEIKFLNSEGGFYGITTAAGRNFEPINLPLSFMKDGIQVEFQYKNRDDLNSIHQWGQLIEIVSIVQIDSGLLKRETVNSEHRKY